MRIHSDVLTENDLYRALHDAREDAPGIYLSNEYPVSVHGSRSRLQAFNVNLRGNTNRRPNSGSYGAADGGEYAASYDDWGHWIARLFTIDPDAKMTYYKDADDFHRQTGDRYRVRVEA